MIFKLSLRFNKHSKTKVEIEAKDRADLDEKLKQKPFWHKNKDRITVERVYKNG